MRANGNGNWLSHSTYALRCCYGIGGIITWGNCNRSSGSRGDICSWRPTIARCTRCGYSHASTRTNRGVCWGKCDIGWCLNCYVDGTKRSGGSSGSDDTTIATALRYNKKSICCSGDIIPIPCPLKSTPVRSAYYSYGIVFAERRR